jgi:hypothetical protein
LGYLDVETLAEVKQLLHLPSSDEQVVRVKFQGVATATRPERCGHRQNPRWVTRTLVIYGYSRDGIFVIPFEESFIVIVAIAIVAKIDWAVIDFPPPIILGVIIIPRKFIHKNTKTELTIS